MYTRQQIRFDSPWYDIILLFVWEHLRLPLFIILTYPKIKRKANLKNNKKYEQKEEVKPLFALLV